MKNKFLIITLCQQWAPCPDLMLSIFKGKKYFEKFFIKITPAPTYFFIQAVAHCGS